MKSILLAGGLALAGTGAVAAPQAAVPAPVAAPAAQPGAAPAGTEAASPTGAAAPAATAGAPAPTGASDPTLGADGVPLRAPVAGIGQPIDYKIGMQEQVTPTGRQARDFHNNWLMPLIVAISVLVLILLAYVVVRFRRAANPVPSRTSHNTLIEVLWTVLPVLGLVVIAVPSIQLLAHQFKPAPANAVTLKAVGNQWYWTYEYPDHGGVALTANMLKEQKDVGAGQRFRTDADGPRLLAADNRVVLPVGVPIRLLTTAADVIHSWAIPAFWVKLDAVPGRINETSFIIEKEGVYFGQCSELCGARHGYMPIAVEAVSPAAFAAWIRAKGGTMPADPAAPSMAAPAQPAADTADDTATPANETAVPTVNETQAASPSTQAATGNPAGAGNVDQ